jgi:hypothetical protein
MSSTLLHRQIKDALTKQRSIVTASPQAARSFLSNLGIEDLATNIGKMHHKSITRKLTTKRVAKKAVAKKKAS